MSYKTFPHGVKLPQLQVGRSCFFVAGRHNGGEMDWREQAVAFYERACEAGLEPHPQVCAFIAARALENTKHSESAVDAEAHERSEVTESPVGNGACAVAEGESADWGVACSGGADSLALLLWLYGAARAGVFGRLCLSRSGNEVAPTYAPTGRATDVNCADLGDLANASAVRFKVLHLDHNLRGADSAGDAAFVAEVADALGWPLYAERLAEPDAPGWRNALGGEAQQSALGNELLRNAPSEEVLRKARQAFFARSGCAVVFQGHHAGDVAETLLMRISRGSGLEGLAAPRPVSGADGAGQPVYLRPLLTWKKAQITELLSGLGIGWREDASNARGDYFRNRVRLDVLPALERAAAEGTDGGRDVLAAAGASRARLQEDAEALEAWLDSVWRMACIPVPAVNNASSDTAEIIDLGADQRTSVAINAPAVSADGMPADSVSGVSDFAVNSTELIDWNLFAPLPRAIRRRALWRLLGTYDLSATLGGSAVDGMLDALEAANLGSGRDVYLSAGRNHFLRYAPLSGTLAIVDAGTVARAQGGPLGGLLQVQIALLVGQSVRLPESSGGIRAQWVLLDAQLRARICSGQVSCERDVYLALPIATGGFEPASTGAVGETHEPASDAIGLVVRHWRAGDRYRPFGAPGSRKVQDIFIDKKVPAAERAGRPVVADAQSGAILWVAGLPPAHGYAVGIGTKWALWLTYTPACKTVAAHLISDERRTTNEE